MANKPISTPESEKIVAFTNANSVRIEWRFRSVSHWRKPHVDHILRRVDGAYDTGDKDQQRHNRALTRHCLTLRLLALVTLVTVDTSVEQLHES